MSRAEGNRKRSLPVSPPKQNVLRQDKGKTQPLDPAAKRRLTTGDSAGEGQSQVKQNGGPAVIAAPATFLVQQFSTVTSTLQEMNARLSTIEERMSAIELRVEQRLERVVDTLTVKYDDLKSDLTAKVSEIEKVTQRLQTQMGESEGMDFERRQIDDDLTQKVDRLTEELKIQAEVLERREKDIRQTNLVLTGLSSQKTGKDLVAEVETSLGQLIKVDLKEKVEHAFRLKRRNEHAKPAILV